MPVFTYQAINESGVSVSGAIESDTLDTATSTLVGRGLIPSKVTAKKTAKSFASFSKIMQRLRCPLKHWPRCRRFDRKVRRNW